MQLIVTRFANSNHMATYTLSKNTCDHQSTTQLIHTHTQTETHNTHTFTHIAVHVHMYTCAMGNV